MFYLNEDRQLMVNITREFMEKEVKPVVMKYEDSAEFPLELYKRAGELGLLGIPFPEDQGGLGSDWTTYALVVEEIGKVMPVLAINIGSSSVLAGGLVQTAGTPEQIEKFMKPANRGDIIFGGAFTEATGGSNFFEMQGSAVRDGDEYVINANKLFITNAGGAADVYLVLVRTGELNPAKAEGFSFFFVEKDRPGFSAADPEIKMGWHGSHSGGLTLKNVRVPKENLLGKEGDGLKYLAYNSPDEFALTGALCLGMAEGAYDMALQYSMERMQQGKSMFDNFQITRHKLANMKMEIEALRDFVFTTYDLRDKGIISPDRSRMLKIKGAKVAEYVCGEAIQLHGGLGVVHGTGVDRFWRDAKISQIAGGSIEALTDGIAQSIKADYAKR